MAVEGSHDSWWPGVSARDFAAAPRSLAAPEFSPTTRAAGQRSTEGLLSVRGCGLRHNDKTPRGTKKRRPCIEHPMRHRARSARCLHSVRSMRWVRDVSKRRRSFEPERRVEVRSTRNHRTMSWMRCGVRSHDASGIRWTAFTRRELDLALSKGAPCDLTGAHYGIENDVSVAVILTVGGGVLLSTNSCHMSTSSTVCLASGHFGNAMRLDT